MKATKLTDELKKSGAPDKVQGRLALFPECLCGFPPPHLNEMLVRLDCLTCQAIIKKFEEINSTRVMMTKIVHAKGAPVRVRNGERLRKYDSWKRIPIVGWFVRPPKLEAEPDCRQEEWFVEKDRLVKDLQDQMDELCETDKPHWGDDANLAISKELIERHLRSGQWQVIAFPVPEG